MKYMSSILQWLHIMSAVLAVGGVFFMRFILYPVLSTLPPDKLEARRLIAPKVIGRFFVLIDTSIAVLIVTGVYRYAKAWPSVQNWVEYQAVFAVKMVFSLLLFAIAVLTTVPTARPNMIQRKREHWLVVNFVLGALVLLLSAHLRRLWDYR